MEIWKTAYVFPSHRNNMLKILSRPPSVFWDKVTADMWNYFLQIYKKIEHIEKELVCRKNSDSQVYNSIVLKD